MKKLKKNKPNFRLLNQQGSLSITAIWILTLLSLLAIGLMRNVLTGFRLDTYALRSTEAMWLARAGIQHAIAVLKLDASKDSLQNYDAFCDTWAHSPAMFKKVPCGNGLFEVSYASREENSGPHKIYGIIDENRKININRVPEEVLLRLPGMNPEKLAALQDWQDQDNKTREEGAEDSYYMNLPSPYHCKNADIDFVEELALVRGFHEEDVRVLSRLVTVYGDGKVNINTASIEVLQILGLDPELSSKIATVKWGPDGIPLTEDDVIFENQANIIIDLMKRIKLTAAEQVQLHRLVSDQLLGITSTHFTIHSVGVTMDGQVRNKTSATVERLSPHDVEILTWRE